MADGGVCMVLDDRDTGRRTKARDMRLRGWTVHEARSLSEAEDIIAQHRPARAICDLNLSDSTGIHTLRRLREASPTMALYPYSESARDPAIVLAVRMEFGVDLVLPTDPSVFSPVPIRTDEELKAMIRSVVLEVIAEFKALLVARISESMLKGLKWVAWLGFGALGAWVLSIWLAGWNAKRP